jgi:hypothetical protein
MDPFGGLAEEVSRARTLSQLSAQITAELFDEAPPSPEDQLTYPVITPRAQWVPDQVREAHFFAANLVFYGHS